MMKTWIMSLIAAAFISLGNVNAEASELCSREWIVVHAVYKAEKGDTLDSIAAQYMRQNTYGKREINEFKSGIIERNSWLLTRDLQPGDILTICFWKKVQ